jgi:putative transposase
MIDRTHALSLTRQAAALGLSRGSVYYVPRPVREADLALMRQLDALHLDFPFAGARMLRRLLRRTGVDIGRRHVTTLMRRMGITAIAPQPGTSRRHRAHPVFPYLLRGRAITRPNQVWAMDITYIPMARGFLFLAAVMDWASRRVLSWRTSVTLTADFCVEAVEEALTRYGRPEIFNTDQGAQFTSDAFTGLLHAHGIAISMDGKGCWRRQHLCRAAVAFDQIRGGLPARVCLGVGSEGRHRALPHPIQHGTTALQSCRPHP